MKLGHFLSFSMGALFTLGMVFLLSNNFINITGYAVANNSSFENESENITEPAQNNWYITDAFKDDNATIFSASCKPNAFSVNNTITKYLCSLYYNDKVELRHVSNTGSMWPNLMGGGYVIISDIKDEEGIKVGDIIIINQTVFGEEVVHRIIEKSYDGEGFYVLTSGDNLKENDGTRIRFDQIVARVVGIVY